MWPGRKKALPWLVSAIVAGLVSLFFGGAWSAALGALAGLATVWFTESGTEGDK